MKKILMMTILLLSMNNVFGQVSNYFGVNVDLTKMSKQQKDSLLMARAEIALLSGADERYYNTERAPVIGYTAPANLGKKFYSVYYLYNPDNELFDEYFSAKVIFDATTGRVLQVRLGIGWAYGDLQDVNGLDIERKINNSENFSYRPWWTIGQPESDYVIEYRKKIKEEQQKLINSVGTPVTYDPNNQRP